MRYELTGIFSDEAAVPELAEFAMRWVEVMHRAASERSWALYRRDVEGLPKPAALTLGPFEAFPDCRFSEMPIVSFKEATIRIRLATGHEEDLDALEDLLEAIGAGSVEIEEQIDPSAFA